MKFSLNPTHELVTATGLIYSVTLESKQKHRYQTTHDRDRTSQNTLKEFSFPLPPNINLTSTSGTLWNFPQKLTNNP